MTHCLLLVFSPQRHCQSSQKPSQNGSITSDNLWPTGNVTDISPSSIGRLVVFGDVVWLLVHSLILGEGLVALASWAGSDLQPITLRLGLIGSAVKNIDESGSID